MELNPNNPNDRIYSHPDIVHMMTKTKPELMEMNETEFRARFRERLHHTLEIQLYHAAGRKLPLPEGQEGYIDLMALVWRERGLDKALPEYRQYLTLRKLTQKYRCTGSLDLSPWRPYELNPADQEVFELVLFQRRSVRQWDLSRRVPDELINRILTAGLWAAHSCNLRSIRYLVVREESCPGLFKGSNIPGGPVHLVVMQDTRAYDANPAMPQRNQLLDCGAASQNMLLAIHAYGLGGVWLTFNEAMKERLAVHFALESSIRIVNYIDVGYPALTPYPPARMGLEDVVLGRA